MNQTRDSVQKTTNAWDENRAHQSRLSNLAKAREANLAKNRAQKDAGFTLSPVVNVSNHSPAEVLHEVNELPLSNDRNDAAMPQYQDRDTETAPSLWMLALTLFCPVLLNAFIDVAYPRVRDYFFKARAEPRSSPTTVYETVGYWNGMSIIRQ